MLSSEGPPQVTKEELGTSSVVGGGCRGLTCSISFVAVFPLTVSAAELARGSSFVCVVEETGMDVVLFSACFVVVVVEVVVANFVVGVVEGEGLVTFTTSDVGIFVALGVVAVVVVLLLVVAAVVVLALVVFCVVRTFVGGFLVDNLIGFVRVGCLVDFCVVGLGFGVGLVGLKDGEGLFFVVNVTGVAVVALIVEDLVDDDSIFTVFSSIVWKVVSLKEVSIGSVLLFICCRRAVPDVSCTVVFFSPKLGVGFLLVVVDAVEVLGFSDKRKVVEISLVVVLGVTSVVGVRMVVLVKRLGGCRAGIKAASMVLSSTSCTGFIWQQEPK